MTFHRDPRGKIFEYHRSLPACYRERPLHAVLCESLKQTKELLTRLEARGVVVPRDDQREVVRLLYVPTRHQVQALAAVLELDGLE